jgi:hypothetical protein
MAVGGSLYVFLHGLTVLTEKAGHFVIVLPDVPGHVHKAGNWLGETVIRHENLVRLRGVSSGGMSLSLTKSTIHLPGTSLTSRKRAATFWLPRPKDLLELLVVTHPAYVVKTKTRTAPQTFTQLATMQILVYDYADENEVRLDGHYWEPGPTSHTEQQAAGGSVTTSSTSLHIISTSEEPEGQEHENETEDVLHEVLRDYPGLEYQHPRPVPPTWIDPLGYKAQLRTPRVSLDVRGEYIVEMPSSRLAFAQAELEHPTLRLARLARLGRLKRAQLSIGSLWSEPDPLGERTSNCVGIGSP